MSQFLSLGISGELVQALEALNITTPTPIQEQAIPVALEGKDLIAQAQTGTGKTFAFLLPIIEKIDAKSEHVQALIVTPTRELALQITNEVQKLIAHLEDVNVLAVYGGQDVEKQLNKLKKNVQIVIATPGRLLDHLRRESIDLSEVSFLVLDEADQMLHIGFLPEVESIIAQTSTERQTMLFSATMSDDVKILAKKHMQNPHTVQIERKQGPAEKVQQLAVQTTDRGKQGLLTHLIRTQQPFMAVIFCRTKRRVSKLFGILKSEGFLCDELHGDLSQAKRERVMKNFREAKVQLLVATDVAARGLDVEGVTHVYNYDIPEDAESYIHRIGRTGRAGMDGLAVTLFTSNDLPLLTEIEKELKISIPKEQVDLPKSGDQKKKTSVKTKEESKKDRREENIKKSKQFHSSKKSGPSSRGRSGSRNSTSSRSQRKR
ncbi:DEAD/DEAH box helicase [Bacillus sp. AGMB 02131]|uniref:DEAD/DEAH box helicase n=1 Tax=Peribacillus faecalis TaxID=2772559 RepID=A0A927HBD3_9BACI|nr:DEAD/DEAH box helicase [Peribacillus faecalis]MBD3108472.1 DEAD/DEAH box helicase [Peribacillus faecalis]